MADRIFVVDDLPDFLELMEDVLTDEGYEVSTFPTIAAALAAARASHPDLLITDLRLEGESGLDLVRSLRADPATRAIPVLVCTAATMDIEEQGEAVLSGDLHVLLKPFDMRELVSRVRDILQGAPSR